MASVDFPVPLGPTNTTLLAPLMNVSAPPPALAAGAAAPFQRLAHGVRIRHACGQRFLNCQLQVGGTNSIEHAQRGGRRGADVVAAFAPLAPAPSGTPMRRA
jgi:hypothetical protein